MTELVADARRGSSLPVALFALTSFVSAGLLFAVEPMVAKMLLPLLGGSASVWNTAMVFFQAALLLGYAYAHLSTRRLGVRRHLVPQLAVFALPLLLLPISVPAGWVPPAGVAPAAWTLVALLVIVGAPFFALATASPTLQRWFSATDHPAAADPYFLYAAGNAGSFLALLGYPLVLERFELGDQARAWAIGYAVFVALAVVCALSVRRTVAPVDPRISTERTPLDLRTKLRWVGLACVPSALMLGVTRHISTDIASIPLLWIVPLGLYLVTFVVAFSRVSERIIDIAARVLRLLIVPAAITFLGFQPRISIGIGLHIGVFLLVALICHGRLAASRPPADRLTDFYLWISLGGVVGGIAAGLVAPVVFTRVLEYPLALALALFALPALEATEPSRVARLARRMAIPIAGVLLVAATVVRRGGSADALPLAMLLLGCVGAGAYVLATSPRAFAICLSLVFAVAALTEAEPTLRRDRTFFGVYRVYEDEAGHHVFVSGTTVHGLEAARGSSVGQPETYYHRTGPIGRYLAATTKEPGKDRFGVVGLGSGALAAYGQPDDRYTFYEIDPAVVDIAEDPSLFTFLRDARAKVSIEVGDGRLELASEANAAYDVLVLDAFSSDAIPIHLLTREAIALYSHRLAPGGVLAFHISNRYFDLAPVLARAASSLGMRTVVWNDGVTPAQTAEGKTASTWVLMGPPGTLPVADAAGPWRPLVARSGAPLWTDSFSDVLSVFRWR